MPNSNNLKQDERYCALCGRKADQVRFLMPVARGYICDECDAVRTSIFDDSEGRIRKRERDPAIDDPHKRHKLELENQADLRKQFKTSVADPKDPEESRDLQNQHGDELANGFMDHPILRDKVQFNGVNENMKLPSMDPEQWENYLEFQLDLQNKKRLTKQFEASITPSP